MGAVGLLLGGAVLGCGAEAPAGGGWGAEASMGQTSQAFVNGGDDRREYFQLADDFQRGALEQFSVVLMTEGAAGAVIGGHVDLLPTWGDINRLCDGEPFVDQPAAAFCSGVLLDWNLVLTSGHCVDAVPLENLRVGFDYYYRSEGELAMTDGDVYGVERVVAAQRDDASPNDEGERLDFAWLELSETVHPPHRPAATYTRSRGAEQSDRVISIGAGGGVPIKWDGGGRVQNTRTEFDDYLIADTDTSQGSSGGGLFDEDLTVIGSLARGAADFALTAEGCNTTSSESDPSAAREQFTYVHRAVEALCDTGSTSLLCNSTCGEPCDAGAQSPLSPEPAQSSDDSGCALTPARGGGGRVLGAALLLATSLTALGRKRSGRRV
jgi:trypsin-like peptidase